ncbi:MAG: DUF4139 domain-containing protein [Anaerolineae bacterium]|nr:DUF4139 domain-containing protein [Anaerolineae bacterium]
MRKMTLFVLFVLFSLIPAGSVLQAQDTPTSDAVAVTIYNQGTALVRDRRTFDLTAGGNVINFTDVAALIDATSVNFVSLTDAQGTRVIEQNYVYDLVDSSALLNRYLDQTIQVTVDDGTLFTGQLLSGRNGEIILRSADGQVRVIGAGQVRDVQFPDLPEGLITRPTLRWLVNADATGANQVELTYLTGGINWTADYNVLLAADNESLDLNGWITLSNNSGTAYREATVKLIAGDVNRAPEAERMVMDGVAMAAPAFEENAVEQRDFNEYKLYEIGRPVTVGNNETKQVEFVTSPGVPATTFFVYDGSPFFYGYYDILTDQFYGQTGITDVQNYLEFSTDDEGGAGVALPAGRMRVYQEDVDGAALLIGESAIDHTPQGETVQIYLGNAFDLVGERTQTDFQIITGSVVQETYEIRLRNRKESGTVEIRVPERLFRWSNWEILNSSQPFEQMDSSSIEFRAQVPAGQEVVITYTVQYSWPR